MNDNSAINILEKQTNLKQLFAMNNNIEKVETVMALKSLKSLIEIDFSDNPVCGEDNYRD